MLGVVVVVGVLDSVGEEFLEFGGLVSECPGTPGSSLGMCEVAEEEEDEDFGVACTAGEWWLLCVGEVDLRAGMLSLLR